MSTSPTTFFSSQLTHLLTIFVLHFDCFHSGDPTAEPTQEPTVEPTQVITQSPTARPTAFGTAYPTSATASPVSFSASQTLTGVTYAEWTADEVNNENTVKTTIAACMDGVTTSDIHDFTASSTNVRRGLIVHLRQLQGNAVQLDYTVSTTSQNTATQLFDQLQTRVSNGDFTIILQQNANGNSATYLLNADSSAIEEVVGDDDDTPVNNDSRLSPGAIAAIVVGSIFGAALVLLAIYLLVVGTGSSNDASYPHKAVEAGPPAEL